MVSDDSDMTKSMVNDVSRSPKLDNTYTRTPKQSKLRNLQCVKSQDLYKRICAGLLVSSRTPPKNNKLTPSRFFKSRMIGVSKKKLKIQLVFVEQPECYILDICKELIRTPRSKNKLKERGDSSSPSLHSMKLRGCSEIFKLANGIIEEVVSEITGQSISSQHQNKRLRRRWVGKGSDDSSMEQKSIQISLVSSSTGNNNKILDGSRGKRKNPFKQEENQTRPPKRSRPFKYNKADSSDEEESVLISSNPILSDDEQEEMDKVLADVSY